MLRSHLPVLIALAPALIIGRFARSDADPDAKAIDAIFAQYDHTNTPGCALGVFRDGRIIYSRGYGMADLNQGVPITPITPFYVASTSKQFTAFSVALAAEQGASRSMTRSGSTCRNCRPTPIRSPSGS
jgi:CubicO group peptidase (beta-lactamase class C family)